LRLHSCPSTLAAGVAEVAPAGEERVAEELVAGVAVPAEARVEARVAAPAAVKAVQVAAGGPVAVAAVRAAVPVGDAEAQGEEMLAADEAEWAEAICRVSLILTIHITNPA
jgi:hypothetical protein